MSFNLWVLFEFRENRIEELDVRRAIMLIQNNNNNAIQDFDRKVKELFSKNLNDTCSDTSIFAAFREPKAPYDLSIAWHIPKCEHYNKQFKKSILKFGAPLYFFKTYEHEEDVYNYKERVRKFIRDIVNVNSLLHPLHAIADTDYNLEALNYNVDKRIGWLNFFSKHEVENIGVDRFKKLNTHRIELLDDGGVFLQLTENVMDASKELKEYVEKVLFGK